MYKIEDTLSKIGISSKTLNITFRIFSQVHLNDTEMTFSLYRPIKSFKPSFSYVIYSIKDNQIILRQNQCNNNSTENNNLILNWRS